MFETGLISGNILNIILAIVFFAILFFWIKKGRDKYKSKGNYLNNLRKRIHDINKDPGLYDKKKFYNEYQKVKRKYEKLKKDYSNKDKREKKILFGKLKAKMKHLDKIYREFENDGE